MSNVMRNKVQPAETGVLAVPVERARIIINTRTQLVLLKLQPSQKNLCLVLR